VNHKVFSLSKPLETGQTVEIKTAAASRPNIAWLNFAVTAKARAKIRQYLKGQESREAEALGERLLRAALGSINYDDISNDEFIRVLEEVKLESRAQLLREIGLGNMMSIAIAKRLLGELSQLNDDQIAAASRGSLAIRGAEGLLLSFAKCCRPIPGDDIIAHVSPGKGLVVHRRECKNVRGHLDEPGRYISVQWESQVDAEFITEVRVEIINHQGALAKLTGAISRAGCNIHGLKTEELDANIYYIDVSVGVLGRKQLADVLRSIRKMPDVQRVWRLRK
jgi:GTP diphosphokinase / guanosine-3',5'-bis(diphosphate) 3'-diphosphatase